MKPHGWFALTLALATTAAPQTGRGARPAALPCDLLFSGGRVDRKSTRLNSSHLRLSRMPSSA